LKKNNYFSLNFQASKTDVWVERDNMIKTGQKFRCFIKHSEESLRDGAFRFAHFNMEGDNCVGQLAFRGRLFTCGAVKNSPRLGVYIVDITGEWHLREDHFRFEVVK
jgi:hypothetical protein